jgi:PKD repeat protein
MKKVTLLLVSFALILLSSNAFSQQSYGGLPISYTNKSLSQEVDRIVLQQPDMNLIMQEDLMDEKNGEMYKVGRVLPIQATVQNSGTWDILPDGTQVWRLQIASRDALALMVLYSAFYLPEGSQLFLYNENRRQLLGSYDHRTNPPSGNKFSTQMIEGEVTNLELVLSPEVNPADVVLNIEGIMYNYRGVDQFVGYYREDKPTGFGNSGACNVNINCPEGDNYQTIKKGVAEIYVVDGMSGGFCSGTLVNNTANDGTPYFLTADHCGGDVTAGDFNQWQFYFHFESANCANPGTAPAYQIITGCTFRARGPMTGGTDFLLVELTTTAANIATINGYYNGWDRGTTASPSGVCIHHPAGDIKKISTYTTALTTSSYPGCLASSHWHAQWANTATSWGITEGGSSGSPLFNGTSKLVVGTLTGGASYCGAPAGSANDDYGKFSQHWEVNGTADNRRLKPWLDPGNTGATTLEGYDPNATGSAPVADFSGTPTTVTVGGSVTFSDLSTNNPTSWSWNFAGGTPATSTAQNPVIVYNTAGTYNVSLTATNASGNDTETKTAYITVVEEDAVVAAFSATPTTVAQGGTVNFTDESIGAITSWNWEFDGGTPATSTIQNPSITYPAAGTYNVTLTVSDGTNSDEEIKIGYIIVTGPAGTLTASFVASDYTITANQCINFNDQTDGNPTSWSWSFPGATPSSSTNQHPTNICYATPGVYDVVLQASNAADQDTYICEDCITVAPDPTQPIANFQANITTIPVGGVVQFTNLSENGPFNQWAWEFEGGTPATFSDSAPPPIAYMQVGVYDVTLRCRKTNNVQDVETKAEYIRVIPEATTPPTANFTANYTVIQPGESINFIDLSAGSPYQWTWEFPGAETTGSNQQNPTGIVYNTIGQHTVRLTVSNNFGADTMEKLLYITVSETDPCTTAPTVAFDATPRLIAAGSTVQFFDLSTGLPSYHTWSFPGGTPATSNEGSPTNGIKYTLPGIYDVTLTVSNACGASTITKERYIYVFSESVQTYCDTLTTINPGEVVEPRVPTGTWGFLAGQNGENIKAYANYFDEHAFSQIDGIIVPVKHAVYGSYSSYVTFYVWDGMFPTPDTVLGFKKVYLRDLTQNQNNVIHFNPPIELNGPFYVGYKINYPDENSDGISDDLFVVGIAAPRVNNPDINQMWVQKSGTWYTTNSYFNFSSALPLQPITCLVDIEELIADNSFEIYPNPTNGIVTIKTNDQYYENFKVEIFDALGRKLNSDVINSGSGEYSTNLGNYPEGLYIVRIYTNEFSINKKLLLTK